MKVSIDWIRGSFMSARTAPMVMPRRVVKYGMFPRNDEYRQVNLCSDCSHGGGTVGFPCGTSMQWPMYARLMYPRPMSGRSPGGYICITSSDGRSCRMKPVEVGKEVDRGAPYGLGICVFVEPGAAVPCDGHGTDVGAEGPAA